MFSVGRLRTALFCVLILGAGSASAFDGKQLKDENSPSCGGQSPPLVNISGLLQYDCGRDNVFVVAQDEKSGRLACAGVERAIQFFAAWGWQTDKLIEIIISPEMSPLRVEQGLSWKVVHGFVDPRDLRVYMGPQPLLANHHGLMSLPYSDEFYTSYVAHEATHVMAQHFYGHQCKLMPSEQQEFVAYFSQISTLESALREEVLQKFAEKRWGPFESRDEINPFYHGMNPHGFAVKSYLYGITPDGEVTFKDFMAGRVGPNNPPMDY